MLSVQTDTRSMGMDSAYVSSGYWARQISNILRRGLLLTALVYLFVIAQALLFSQQAEAQVLDLNTPATTKYVGHTFNVNVRVNTQGQAVDTIAVRNLNFDPALLEITATSVQTVFASQLTLENTTNNTAGTKRLDIGKLPATANLVNSSAQTFAILTFRVLNAGSGSTTLSFDFDPTPTTSGTFLSGVKNLTAANPLNIILAEDNTSPVIGNCSPAAGATNVLVITTVACDFQDLETGVFLGGTSFVVNGVTYTNLGPNTFSASTIASGYRLTVSPASQLPYFSTITVSATTQDNAFDNGPVLARNTGTLAPYTFQTEQDVDAPQLYGQNPAAGAVNVPISTNLVLRLRDLKVPNGYPGTGLDLGSVSITVSAPGWGSYIYTQSGSPSFGLTPLAVNYNYEFLLTMPQVFPENTLVSVQVDACDLRPVSPNCLNTSYQFTTIDTTAPVCSLVSPTPGAANVPTAGQVIINCSDNGVGVNINSVNLFVGGINYTATGPDLFTYTGSPASYQIVANFPPALTSEFAFPVILTGNDNNANQAALLAFGLATGVGNVVCPPVLPGPPATGGSQDTIIYVPVNPTQERCAQLFPPDKSVGPDSKPAAPVKVEQTSGFFYDQIAYIPLWLIVLAIIPWMVIIAGVVYILSKKYKQNRQ